MVSEAKSGDDGAFEIELDAGDYIVTATTAQAIPPEGTAELAVTVTPSTYETVVITIDSGVRAPGSS